MNCSKLNTLGWRGRVNFCFSVLFIFKPFLSILYTFCQLFSILYILAPYCCQFFIFFGPFFSIFLIFAHYNLLCKPSSIPSQIINDNFYAIQLVDQNIRMRFLFYCGVEFLYHIMSFFGRISIFL